jgi:Arc/MetJ family transcription regulator
MQTFDIEITEISTRIIQIDANTITEAMEIAGLLYKREEIQLELSDHKRTEIDITEMKAYNHEAMNQFLKKRHLQQLRYWILKN